jgi:hypothetical protein
MIMPSILIFHIMLGIFYMVTVSYIYFMIMFGTFFVFSHALAVIVMLAFLISCPPMDNIIIIFISVWLF